MDTTQRFSERVADYVKYRPGYPAGITDLLHQMGALHPESVVADIGSGTGLSAKILLDDGAQVFGVEPNDSMRKAAENWLNNYSLFTSINGNSSDTSLPDHSIDLIICAQAFHWFERNAAKKEFQRIAKPDANVALIWNNRLEEDPFMKAYQKIIDKHSIDYQEINHLLITDKVITDWFSPNPMQGFKLAYQQRFDLKGLIGRTTSCSYMPMKGHLGYDDMEKDLCALFDHFQDSGIVIFAYETNVYIGKI